MILKINNLEFSYNSHPVIRNVSFEVNRGEFLSILGNNGAGKTTLLRCINRILRPKKGVVLLDKKDLSKLPLGEIAKIIGYIPQRQDVTGFTVFDMVLLGRKPHIRWDISEKDLMIVHNVLELLNLEDLALRPLDSLSGGELQKVLIARALAQEPEILLLDEPTNNLDLRNQIEVLRIIKDIVKKNNMTGIVVLHDVNLALRYSDKFLLIKDNTVFAYGGKEIITPQNIEAVYGIPVIIENVNNIPVVIPIE